MKTLKTLFMASFLAIGATSLVAAPALAADKKAEMKCDASGKACKKGADCKAENCKKEEPKAK
jgi:Spy/CpxP family protein refolding chaperone